MVNYVEIFDRAFGYYKKQDKRQGYSPGLFTNWRHSRKLYPALKSFYTDLQSAFNSGQDENTIAVIKKHLTELSKKNHSFSMYMIDELMKYERAHSWEEFDPKRIVLSKTKYVYRGSLQTPEDAEAVGYIQCPQRESEIIDIENYVSVRNWGYGVSTSKNYDTALDYASVCHINGRHTPGYVYAIDVSKFWGIDIAETQTLRYGYAHQRDISMQEINYLQPIPWECVKEYQKMKSHGYPHDAVINPVYNKDYAAPHYTRFFSSYFSDKDRAILRGGECAIQIARK
jgi:hypothetical protein